VKTKSKRQIRQAARHFEMLSKKKYPRPEENILFELGFLSALLEWSVTAIAEFCGKQIFQDDLDRLHDEVLADANGERIAPFDLQREIVALLILAPPLPITLGPWTAPPGGYAGGKLTTTEFLGGGLLVSWLTDTSLRDLVDNVAIEATCIRCLHVWLQSPVQLLLKVDRRDVHMDEVARNLACPKAGCRHIGGRLALLKNEDTSGFIGGLP
jgi:hypothetical protein